MERDVSNGRTPQNIREVGFVVDAIKTDLQRLEGKFDLYVTDHRGAHRVLEASVNANTDFRKERQVWERLAKWAIGTNLVAIVALVLALITFASGQP